MTIVHDRGGDQFKGTQKLQVKSPVTSRGTEQTHFDREEGVPRVGRGARMEPRLWTVQREINRQMHRRRRCGWGLTLGTFVFGTD